MLIEIDKNLKVVPIELGFKEAIFQAFDEEIIRFLLVEKVPKQIEETENFIRYSVEQMEKGADLTWVILFQETFIGCCGVHGILSRKPHFGLWIKKEEQGKGHGRKIVETMLRWILQNLDIDYVRYPVDRRNVRSISLLRNFQLTPATEYELVGTVKKLDLLEYWFYKNKLLLRPAILADLPILQKWDENPHVMDSDPNDEWDWEIELSRNPTWREQLVGEVGGRAIGFIQIIDPEYEETQYWGKMPSGYRAIDIWIGEEQDLGKGYGTEMMKLAIGRCFADKNVETILLDPLASNTQAHRFYERLGFRFVREQQFGEDHCRVYQLTRIDFRENKLGH